MKIVVQSTVEVCFVERFKNFMPDISKALKFIKHALLEKMKIKPSGGEHNVKNRKIWMELGSVARNAEV